MECLAELLIGGDVPRQPLAWYHVAARAVLVYICGVLCVRVGKSRLLGHASAVDILLGFILGSLLSRGITGDASFSGTLIATIALVTAHGILTTVARDHHRWGQLFKGSSYVLVEQGEVREANLRRAHLSREDLLEALRLNGAANLHEVALACKERNGEISVIKKSGA